MEKLYFSEVIGSTYYPVDSISIKSKAQVVFDIQAKPTGFYKIHFSDTNIVDIIINNKEEIEITFHDSILQNGVEVIKSRENTLLWNYKYYSRNIQQLQKQIMVQQSYMNSNDSMYVEFGNKLDTLESLKRSYLKTLVAENPDTYFKKTVYAAYPPEPKDGQTKKQVHFYHVDFNDPTLIRSSIFSGLMMDYLQQYTEYSEEGFQESIDYMVALANQNQEVYEYCLNYLLEVFNLVGPDIIFDYLIENYLLEGGCFEANVSEEFKSISEGYRKLMPGNKAPVFSIKDTSRKEINSVDLYSKTNNLIFFWSSQCGHCHEAIPELIKLTDSLNIIAISLDTNAEDWMNYINENKLPFYHYSDLKGWDGATHKLFKVHKTPSYYLVDKRGYITYKPKSIYDLLRLMLGIDKEKK